MTTRNLDALFHPKSIAIIGATERAGAVGAAVTRNALGGAFAGPIWLVNRKGGRIAGRPAPRSIRELPAAPDLAVIATPPDTVPPLVAELGAAGTRAAVVITAGFGEGSDPRGAARRQAMLDAARPHLLRLVGPNCVGFLAPRHGLNASFAPAMPPPGKLAFVGQSGAIITAVIDWAADRGIGFSYLVSMGGMADVDFGDVLDYLALDPETRGVLLYIEGVTNARKFMSAARALARLKPVVVLKAGRHAEGARAAQSHTGAMAGSDVVYDAAFRRAGLVRVATLAELFDASATLALARPPERETLAIVSNGGGIGVLATDWLIERGGRLATLAPATIAALDKVLPPTWSRSNPVDIIGDADAGRYRAALDALADDPGIGAVLALNAPTALASAEAAARAVAESAAALRKPLLASWTGGANAALGRRVFAAAGIPAYDEPAQAASAFMHLVEYKRGQVALMETPPAMPEESPPDRDAAERVIAGALAEGRSILSEPEAKRVLAAFRIPAVRTEIARDEEETAAIAGALGFPVALKVYSRDITHKSDVGGVALDLDSAAAVRRAATDMRRRVAAHRPGARIDGFTLSPMVRRPGAYELILGAVEDPMFGPVILFGQGGTAAEIVGDRAVALPPLNLSLADAVMRRTRIDRLLQGFRDRAPAARGEIARTLVRLSQLIAEFPEIVELDINPLIADATGVVAVDARVVVRGVTTDTARTARFAIRPYPAELDRTIAHRGRRYRLRPIRPEDEPALRDAFKLLSPDDVRLRFFAPLRDLSHEMAARLTQIDYDREMALVLLDTEAPSGAAPLGVVRLAADPNFEEAEFAIVVVSGQQGRGLGGLLMAHIVEYARRRGIKRVFGDVLADNQRMLALAEQCGFARAPAPTPSGIVRVTRAL
jgi:acetyltransferase